MSVNYSTSIGYGYAFEVKDAPSCLNEMDPYEDGDIPGWLEENGLDEIDYEYGGDWMNGDNVCCFFLRGTSMRIDAREYSDSHLIVSFDTPVITKKQAEQFVKLAELLELDNRFPSWKLVNNVS